MEIVLVTGGNRGIGFEICKQLDALGYQVIMTSRSLENGLKAAKALSSNVIVKQLDINSEESIHQLQSEIEKEFSHIDILINNAGIGADQQELGLVSKIKSKLKKRLYKPYQVLKTISPLMKKAGVNTQTKSVANVDLWNVRALMETNLYGAWKMIQVFQSLLSKSPKKGRIINISSGMGEMASLNAEYPAYRLSKLSLNAITKMFAVDFEKIGIRINAVCPGWVRTDMGGPDAPRTLEQGVETIIWLITEDLQESGKFFRDKQIIDW